MLLDGLISYLFFSSFFAFLVLLPGFPVFLNDKKRRLQNARKQEMNRQFLEGIQMTAASLAAGYSIENAVKEAWKELSRIYPKDSFIIREFQILVHQTEMNRSMEQLFLDLGNRSGVEDIQSFGEVFLTARRTGGDLLSVIRNTCSCIRQKQETLMEIETCLAGKVMEQNIMSAVPLLILGYIRLTSPEFRDGMYGNVTGAAVMTICLIVYGAAYLWGRSIVNIEV